MRISSNFQDRASNWIIRGLIGFARLLPYRIRVPFFGRVNTSLISPLLGYPARVRENLALVCPEIDRAKTNDILRASTDNMGRTLIEMYSGKAFVDRVVDQPLTGPGLPVLERARDAGKPVILITGHFGNYEAPRAALIAQGCQVAAIYRPMNNPYFNAHYTAAMKSIGPAYSNDKKGLTGLVRHIRGGGMAEFLIDQSLSKADTLQFFGKPAHTTTTPAELSLKYDAPLVCMYGIRKPDGLSFEMVVEDPIVPGDPKEMTQAINDSLEQRVRENMGQWSWSHRRWKAFKKRDQLI